MYLALALFDKELLIKFFVFDCRMSASEVAAEASAGTVHVIHFSDRQSIPQEEGTTSLEELNKVDYAMERKKSLKARYYFGIIFLMMNLVAWFFRDYGQSVLPWIHCKPIFYPSQYNLTSFLTIKQQIIRYHFIYQILCFGIQL